MTFTALRHALHAAARPGDAEFLQRFFKTGPGQYSEGDKFIGVRVPDIRRLLPPSDTLSDAGVLKFVRSPIHEERLLGLLIWVRRFERAGGDHEIFRAYLRETAHINNWDLVDASAPQIVGGWLWDHPAGRKTFHRLVRSKNLWERRIAMVATFFFIRRGDTGMAWEMAEALLGDTHDLIHKASGWMLREMGGKDLDALREFLSSHAAVMPRTMLRYAIEKLGPAERAQWMKKRLSRSATQP